MSPVNPERGDLAGRWLSRFLTDHLAGERDLSPQTISSYRDAIKLLLTWFRDAQATPPEKLASLRPRPDQGACVPGLAARRTR